MAGLRFVVAVNLFDGRLDHDLDDVRWAFAVNEEVPVITFNARERSSVRDALIVVLERALERARRSSAGR